MNGTGRFFTMTDARSKIRELGGDLSAESQDRAARELYRVECGFAAPTMRVELVDWMRANGVAEYADSFFTVKLGKVPPLPRPPAAKKEPKPKAGKR